MTNFQKNIYRGYLTFQCLKPFFERLNELQIMYAVIKGDALSLQVYNQVGIRTYSDVDILICRGDVSIVINILKKLGFSSRFEENILNKKNRVLTTLSHQIMPYVKEYRGVTVEIDINLDLFWGEYRGKRINVVPILQRTCKKSIYESVVNVLSIQDAFIELCLHHYKDLNSLDHLLKRNPYKKKRFEDVYWMIKNNSVFTPSYVRRIANKYGVVPYIYYVLKSTSYVIMDNYLDPFLQTLWDPEGERLLEYYDLANPKKWGISFYERLENDNLKEYIEENLTIYDRQRLDFVEASYRIVNHFN